MGTWIIVLAVACSTAAMVGESAAPPVPVREIDARDVAPRVSLRSLEGEEPKDALSRLERDFARRQAELGLVGASPLFGAEGLPKPPM